jgi:hypothetical protein
MQEGIFDLVKKNAVRERRTKEEFLKDVAEKTAVADELARVKLENQKLKVFKLSTDRLKGPMNDQASNLGRLLQMQKATKPFRVEKPLDTCL